MGRLTRRHGVLGAVTAAVAAGAMLAGTATAGKPLDQFHDHFTDSFTTDLCGISDVDAQIRVTDNFFVFADSFKDTSSVRITYTNPANGKSVIVFNAGLVLGPPPIVDEAAGTITFLTSYKGLPEKIQTAHGPVLLRDAGIITFADTFDLDTGDFISTETVVNKGPHPEADSDFTLFCQVITGALS